MSIVWTRAEGHSYGEALALIQARGYSQGELDEFLAGGMGTSGGPDIHRVPEAFPDKSGPSSAITYAAPGGGGGAAALGSDQNPGLISGTGSGPTSQPFSTTVNVAPSSVSVGGAAAPIVNVMGAPISIAGMQIPRWVLIAGVAVVAFVVWKKVA